MKNFNPVIAVISGVVALFAIILVATSFYVVKAGERAIAFRFGNITEVQSEGLHFRIPFIETYERVDIRTKQAHSPAPAGTRDLQSVDTTVQINYHLEPTRLKETYSKFGMDLSEKVIAPRILEIVKAVSARYSAEELLLKREAVKGEIATSLRTSLSQYNIVVEDIQITDFSFSKEFRQAIESKQTSLQYALKARNDLERIKVEAEQTVTTAKAEAEAIQIKSSAIQKQGGSDYVKLKFIEKWDGQLPQVSSENVMMMMGK